MPKKVLVLDPNDPKLNEKILNMAKGLVPKDVANLGKILRRRSYFFFHRFLRKHGVFLTKEEEKLFMEHLITHRIDLKDMEPEARRRLRQAYLAKQDPTKKTYDYIQHVERASSPKTCKDCQWFRKAPEGEEKDCVEMGSKGDDKPCYGFTLKKLA